jgi:protein-S-isoprenylcysteine O-methyltransferase Ste14
MYMEVRMSWSAFGVLEKLWSVMIVFWLLTAIGQKRAVFRESIGNSAAFRVETIVGVLLMFSGWAAVGFLAWQVTPQSAAMEWLALSIGIAGFGIAFWARILLGGEWSAQVTLKENHRLIVAGPYAVVRHPIYSGLVLAMLGTAIAGGQLRMYLATAIIFAAFWNKSRLEERLLARAMGDRYVEYQHHTYALIPGLL